MVYNALKPKNKTDLWWGIYTGLGETRATEDENLKKKKKKRGLGMIFAIFFLQHLWYKINKTSEKREKNILPQKQDVAKKETLLMEIFWYQVLI